MTASGHFVAVITIDGSLCVWDVLARQSSLRASIQTLLVPGAGTAISELRLDRRGRPLVSLSNRRLYQYDEDLGCWIRLSDELFPGSFFPNSLQPSLLSTGPLQSASIQEALSRLPVAGPPATYQEQTRASVTHLEDQLACALSLGQAQTYQHCLCAYVRKLVQLCGDQGMQKEVVLELMGPMQGSASGSGVNGTLRAADGWCPLVLGLSKRELLRRLLPELAACSTLQRLAERLNHAFQVLEEP
jgi:protein HIRA/HIR1